MNDVLEMANANLLMNADVMGCNNNDRNTLLADFAKARRHIRFMLTTRLAWCRYLPWILAGIGHHVLDTAIACAVRALQLFESSPDTAMHHPLTLLFCSVNTVVGQQLRLFASRART